MFWSNDSQLGATVPLGGIWKSLETVVTLGETVLGHQGVEGIEAGKLLNVLYRELSGSNVNCAKIKRHSWSHVVAHACNLNTPKTEAGGSGWL